ncbi:MAG: flavin reductase [Deltaproteobacteria bacterium]|nr:flavin reductase [Deltaproteobacteria bacterium]
MNTRALEKIGYGLYVVSSRKGDKLNGQIANALIQTTSEPLAVAVSINRENFTHQCIEDSRIFSVSILSEDTDIKLLGTFGFKDGRELDKFSSCSYKIGMTAAPVLLESTLAYLEVKLTNQLELTTHTLFVGEVVEAEVIKEGIPMTYAYYHQVKGGKTPKRAATYIPGLQSSSG